MKLSWILFKEIAVNKGLSVQMDENDSRYVLWMYDGPVEYRCSFLKEIPANEEQYDFETTLKSTVNGRLQPIVDEDGAQVTNPKFAGSGRAYNSLHLEVSIGVDESLYCKDRNGADIGYVSMWTEKADGTVITNPAEYYLAETTKVLLAPLIDYDIQGFCLYQNTRPANDVRMWAVTAPFAPVEYGGQKEVITGLNLKLSPYDKTFMDYVGDSATPIKYQGPGSNEQLLIFKHPQNTDHKIMGELFWYV